MMMLSMMMMVVVVMRSWRHIACCLRSRRSSWVVDLASSTITCMRRHSLPMMWRCWLMISHPTEAYLLSVIQEIWKSRFFPWLLLCSFGHSTISLRLIIDLLCRWGTMSPLLSTAFLSLVIPILSIILRWLLLSQWCGPLSYRSSVRSDIPSITILNVRWALIFRTLISISKESASLRGISLGGLWSW